MSALLGRSALREITLSSPRRQVGLRSVPDAKARARSTLVPDGLPEFALADRLDAERRCALYSRAWFGHHRDAIGIVRLALVCLGPKLSEPIRVPDEGRQQCRRSNATVRFLRHPCRCAGYHPSEDACVASDAACPHRGDGALHFNFSEFAPITIANRKARVPAFLRELIVYGLR